MSKFLKFCAVLISAIFAVSNTAWAATTIDKSWWADIDGEIAASTSLTVERRKITDNTVDTTLSFSAKTGVTLADPWVIADQYLKIAHSSNYALWGARIVSDNITMLNSKISPSVVQFTNPANPYYMLGAEYSSGGITYLSYSGLVRTDVTKWPNPSDRGPLAWQVRKDNMPTASPVVIGTNTPNKPTLDAAKPNEYSETDVGSYGAKWGWIADKTLHEKGDVTFANKFDDRIFTGVVGGFNTYNDNLIAFGTGAGGGNISSHNGVTTDYTAGDGDVAVYLAVRYGNTNWSASPTFRFLLGAGKWSSRLMIELINE